MQRKITDFELIEQGLNPRYITPEFLGAHFLNETFPVRFLGKVQKTDFHWIWTGCKRPRTPNDPNGHGQIKRRGGICSKKIYAHVASWLLHNGPIPDGKMVLHKCPGGEVPYCVNPDHLYLGDGFDNMRDMTLNGRNHFSKTKFNGDFNAMAILSWESVRSMRLEYREMPHNWGKKQKEREYLSRKYGVSVPTVIDVLRKHSWIE